MEIIKGGVSPDSNVCDPNGSCDDGVCAHNPCDIVYCPPICFCIFPWV